MLRLEQLNHYEFRWTTDDGETWTYVLITGGLQAIPEPGYSRPVLISFPLPQTLAEKER